MAPKVPSADHHQLTGLPPLAASPADIGRLLRELEAVDSTLLQLSLRAGATSADEQHEHGHSPAGHPGHPKAATKVTIERALPKISRLLDQTAQLNQLNLLQADDRTALQQFLERVKQQSPVLHVSFSAEPAPAFVEKLMSWLRQEIHPSVLLIIGLQPTIGAGCIVRSTNRQFDFSLRQDFLSKRQLLLDVLLAPPTLAEATP
jgi:hypothetical protein